MKHEKLPQAWGAKIYCIYSQLFDKLKRHGDRFEFKNMKQSIEQSTPSQAIAQHYPVHITELELAINYWRQLHPAPRDSMTLCRQAALLAEYYAVMIIQGEQSMSSTLFGDEARLAYEEVYTTLKSSNAFQKAA